MSSIPARVPFLIAALVLSAIASRGARASDPTFPVLSVKATALATTTTVVDLPIGRRSATVRIAYTRPAAPRAALIELTGGNGVADLQLDGMPGPLSTALPFCPVHRTRQLFVDRGYSVVVVDVASDAVTGLGWAYRESSDHLSELRAVLDYVRQRDNVPTWVWGHSAGTLSAANMGLNIPLDQPFGVVLQAPVTFDPPGVDPTILDMRLEAMRRPVLVMNHAYDPCPYTRPADAGLVASRLTSTPAHDQVVFTGGSADTRPVECDGTGYHGLGGLETELVNTIVDWTTRYAHLSQAPNYTALWWNPSESGWGINVNHQSDTLFATLFTYDAAGTPMWLVMSSGVREGSSQTFSGPLYRTTGSAFNAHPFVPIGPANTTQVGTMTLSFSSSNAATLAYSVNGATVTKAIVRQVYGSRAANCMPTSAARGALANYQDLWWNPDESGWGINITHQDNILFATLFTYDAGGNGMWLVMSTGLKQADGSYAGDLYKTTGSAFNAQPFVPITAANITKVGTLGLSFMDGMTGSLSYSVNGVAVTKAITRQQFASAPPWCS